MSNHRKPIRKLLLDTVKELYREWKELSHNERGKKVEFWAKLYNVDESQIYRKFRKLELGQPIKHRADKGKCRKYSDQQKRDICRLIAALMQKTATQTGTCSIEIAVQILFNAAQIPELLPVSTVGRWFRELGISTRHFNSGRFAVSIKAEKPMQVLLVDASTSSQVYVRDKDGKPIWAPEIGKDKNHGERLIKERNLSKVWFFCAIDMYSKLFDAMYIRTPGESAEAWRIFLTRTFLPKKDAHLHPLCGIPRFIYCDKSSALKGELLENFFFHLCITVKTHFPGKSSAKGLVERQIGIIKSSFEKVHLRLFPGANVDEMNARLHQWIVADIRHVRRVDKGTSRLEKFLSISRSDLKIPTPDQLVETAYFHDSRKITSYGTIELDKKEYLLPDDGSLLPGYRIEVYSNIHGVHARQGDRQYFDLKEKTDDCDRVRMFDGHPYRSKPTKESLLRNEVEKLKKDILDFIKPEHLMPPAPNVLSLPPKGVPADIIPAPVEKPKEYMNLVEAQGALYRKVGQDFSHVRKDLIDEINDQFAKLLNLIGHVPEEIITKLSETLLDELANQREVENH